VNGGEGATDPGRSHDDDNMVDVVNPDYILHTFFSGREVTYSE